MKPLKPMEYERLLGQTDHQQQQARNKQWFQIDRAADYEKQLVHTIHYRG